MSVKQCLIVGGGITGCISAIVLAKRGHSVTLCESTAHLGGVLRDHQVQGKTWFSNCQYLSVSERWLDLLPDSLQQTLYQFDHQYGSISEFHGSKVVAQDLAVPIFAKGTYDEDSFAHTLDNSTLTSRLNFYPDRISQHLQSWAERSGVDPGVISGKNAMALQFGRIHLADQDELVVKLKQHEAYDDTLALPLRSREPGNTVQAALPRQGYNVFFDALERYLCSLGITVLKSTPVKIKSSKAGVSFWTRAQQLDPFSAVVWASNPNALLAGLNRPVLNNICGKSQTHYFDIQDHDVSTDPRYIQIFSDRTPVNRLYYYSLAGDLKLTVECFETTLSTAEITIHATRLLKDFGMNVTLDWQGARNEKRYVFYTEDDKATLDSLISSQPIPDCKLIDSGWLDFGRDAKINRIFSQLAA